jgi:hypothetical protein
MFIFSGQNLLIHMQFPMHIPNDMQKMNIKNHLIALNKPYYRLVQIDERVHYSLPSCLLMKTVQNRVDQYQKFSIAVLQKILALLARVQQ